MAYRLRNGSIALGDNRNEAASRFGKRRVARQSKEKEDKVFRFIAPLAILVVTIMANTSDAQIYIQSGGGQLHIDNWTSEWVSVGVKNADGTVTVVDYIPPEGWRDYEYPAAAIGATLVVTGLTTGTTVTHTIGSGSDSSDGAPEDEAVPDDHPPADPGPEPVDQGWLVIQDGA